MVNLFCDQLCATFLRAIAYIEPNLAGSLLSEQPAACPTRQARVKADCLVHVYLQMYNVHCHGHVHYNNMYTLSLLCFYSDFVCHTCYWLLENISGVSQLFC